MEKIKEPLWDFIERKFQGKFDKGGNPYVIHLCSVQKRFMDKRGKSFFECNVASLLHDILEDTDTTEEELLNVSFVNERVLELVKILTRR